ncbi:hypothetical protein EV121DRAFT_170104, partial [Schizophyllum commune]
GCHTPVDIVLQSCDGHLVGAHTRSLEMFGEAFPASRDAAAPNEPIPLAERAEVLRLLLHYMHCVPQPPLDGIPGKLFRDFTDAVEKYGVHAAGQVCDLRMRASTTSAPLMVLRYALRYGHNDLLAAAAPLTIAYSCAEARPWLPEPDIFVQWVRDVS